MNLSEVWLYITYYIDDPSTWFALVQTCKRIRDVCKYREEQKKWQFKRLYISFDCGFIMSGGSRIEYHAHETEEACKKFVENFRNQLHVGGYFCMTAFELFQSNK